MKISAVTISFNQATFLERTIRSVIDQKNADFEYIIVDPGSTDGSREIIERYRGAFSAVLLEPDRGPRDGLNKGFAQAKGDIFFYLNSDDTIEPGAFETAIREFERDPALDILCGHCWVIDENDVHLRRAWSDPWQPASQAYVTSIQIQPSTYLRAEMFRKVGGFSANEEIRLGWDGELITDMCLGGAKMKIIDAFLSNFRLHGSGLTAAGYDEARWRQWRERQFRKIMGRDMTPADEYIWYWWFLRRQVRNPRALLERILRGRVYKRFERKRDAVA
jgi:glycosyltransferase involved in cell wall biosynthesis